MHAWSGRWSGLSHSQHCQSVSPLLPPFLIPYPHNLLMEGLATRKLKRCLVEPCWWGTHNSPHLILITFSGKFQACQEVFSCNIAKYWVSQFQNSLLNQTRWKPQTGEWKVTLNVLTFITLTKCVMAEAPSESGILWDKLALSVFSTCIPLLYWATSLH